MINMRTTQTSSPFFRVRVIPFLLILVVVLALAGKLSLAEPLIRLVSTTIATVTHIVPTSHIPTHSQLGAGVIQKRNPQLTISLGNAVPLKAAS